MNTMIIVGMGIKIASVCLVGMASSEGLTFFQTKRLKDLKGKSSKGNKRSASDFREERKQRGRDGERDGKDYDFYNER